jgi:3-hydroxyisobutyrate dehydrogenase-like beta-hydroxyacid dehydrogenase
MFTGRRHYRNGMDASAPHIAFIGFGEAGMAFAEGLPSPAIAYDRKTASRQSRRAKLEDYAQLGMAWAETSEIAIRNAGTILSLVTADNALEAARQAARSIAPGALYCDMNSVAPETKHAAAEAIAKAGGRYADVAVMAPVYPQRREVPLLTSGAHTEATLTALQALGFTGARAMPGPVGAASSVKMVRSVMIKGLEALTTECMLAAQEAGVIDEVVASLDASWPGTDWATRADYNLERMMVHGVRRAEEMEQVAETLEALGVEPAMTRATIKHQRTIGRLDLAPSVSLTSKLSAILSSRTSRAA